MKTKLKVIDNQPLLIKLKKLGYVGEIPTNTSDLIELINYLESLG